MFPEFLVTSLPESVICDNPLMTPMSCAADNDKSNEDRQKEEELLQQIHKLVETRDFLVDDVEFERLRCLYGLMTSTFHAGQHRSLMTAVCERRSLTCSWWLRGLSYQECRSCISARCLSFNERCVSVRQWARPNELPLVEELCKCLLLFRFLCTCDVCGWRRRWRETIWILSLLFWHTCCTKYGKMHVVLFVFGFLNAEESNIFSL